MKLKSINPATEEVVGEVEVSTREDVLNTVSKARKAFETWKATPLSERIELIKNVEKEMEKRKSELAELTVKEMGKTITSATKEVDDVKFDIEEFIKDTRKYLGAETVDVGDAELAAQITFEPVGVEAIITPWNYPVGVPFEGIILSLLVGNTVVFKHSENTCLMGQKFDEMFKAAGFPEGVFNVVHGAGDVGQMLVESPVNLIMFTGSVATGKKIAEIAGRGLKKVVLELGGSDAFVVFGDMDAGEMGKLAARKRFHNCGEICVSPKRFFIHESIADGFIKEAVKTAKELKVGNPMDKNVEMGPLVNKKQLELIESQVNDSVSAGAKVLAGGKRIEGKGCFYEPTVLADVKSGMRAMKEETFGPVMAIDTFGSDEEAIQKANNTVYGLGGSVWTKDVERGKRIAAKIDTGMVGVNGTVMPYPNLPWVGKKSSGMGRARSRYGILELVHTKPVIVKKATS